ncbi:MAG: hypothetical protein ACTSO7_15825, partial [Candidatus Heimdallarchaeota archaeon]
MAEKIPLIIVPRKKISKTFIKNLRDSFSKLEITPSLVLLYDHTPNFKGLNLPTDTRFGLIKEIVNVVSKEFDWFRKLEGYGFFRLIQFLCAPKKVIFRDDDTLELGSELLDFQISYLGKKVKNVLSLNEHRELLVSRNEEEYRIGHIIGLYRGKNLLQFSDKPSPIELLKLDGIWYNPNKSDELYRHYAVKGKTDEIDGKKIFLGNFFYGNHGCSAQTRDYYSIIPPMDGWVRGNDDTNASRILFYLKRKTRVTSAMINYGVKHHFQKGITQNQTNRNLTIHVNTVFFEPLGRWIFSQVKELNKGSLSADSVIKKVGSMILNQEYYDLETIYHNHVKRAKKKIVNVINELKSNHNE